MPVAISTRVPPGSTTGPLRERIAESDTGQVLGSMIVRRFAHSVLKTASMWPLASEIATT